MINNDIRTSIWDSVLNLERSILKRLARDLIGSSVVNSISSSVHNPVSNSISTTYHI